MKTILILLILLSTTLEAQSKDKQIPSSSELEYIRITFEEISKTDQLYRGMLSYGTTDEAIISKIDSVFDTIGLEAGLSFQRSLNLVLSEEVEDSLWQLQHAIDFRNHQFLRAIFDRYGWISKDQVQEKNHVQLLLLMHPPKDWDVPVYLDNYSALLYEEVKSGRMPAKTYAMFYDNIKGKILKELQLYGTNGQYDRATNQVLPAEIKSIKKTNKARKKIGLPPLQEGEYRLASE